MLRAREHHPPPAHGQPAGARLSPGVGRIRLRAVFREPSRHRLRRPNQRRSDAERPAVLKRHARLRCCGAPSSNEMAALKGRPTLRRTAPLDGPPHCPSAARKKRISLPPMSTVSRREFTATMVGAALPLRATLEAATTRAAQPGSAKAAPSTGASDALAALTLDGSVGAHQGRHGHVDRSGATPASRASTSTTRRSTRSSP